MNAKSSLQSLVQEAELYLSQGLLREARGRYETLMTLLERQEALRNRETLLDKVRKRLNHIDAKFEQLDAASHTPTLTRQAQDLIKKLFSGKSREEDPETQALDGAIVLAKFGQYERALEEFGQMLAKPNLCVPAAKNILRCHIALGSPQVALDQYEQWRNSTELSDEALEKVRFFLTEQLKRHGALIPLLKRETHDVTVSSATLAQTTGVPPQPEMRVPDAPVRAVAVETDPDEEMMDINSIMIAFGAGPMSGRKIELDVSFQSGNIISLLIPGSEKEMIAGLAEGTELKEIQFFSPIAIFQGRAWVQKCARITAGPKNGSFNVDLKVSSS